MEKRTDTKIIVATGAESTGKTELCRYLAQELDIPWVPELARGYIEQLGRHYTYDDVVEIAQRQIAEFKSVIAAGHAAVLFDTDLIITKVWFDVVYGKCPDWIPEAIRTNPASLHLLCKTDIPWVADSVRENGGPMREKLSAIYRNELEMFGLPYVEIGGSSAERRQTALDAVIKVIMS